MGWPKGKPRKGHVNKDGTTHAPRGSRLKASKTLTSRTTNGTPKPKAQRALGQVALRPAKAGEAYPEGIKPWDVKPEWKSLLVHKNGPWTEFCPECGFPEADGGYCPACGWHKSIGVGKW